MSHLPLSPKSTPKSPASEPVSVQSDHFNALDGDIILRSTLLTPGYPHRKQPPTVFRLHKSKLIAGSPIFAEILAKTEDNLLLRPFGDAPVLQFEEGCKALDLMLRFIYDDLDDHPESEKELFADLIALLEAAAKYKLFLLQNLTETVLRHRALDTPAKDALLLYCKAVGLKRDELGKAACQGIVKAKFSELPEDVLKTLPSEAIIVLVKSYTDV